mmetsp:Transcript_32857/g.76716  ORF Transcript_32857/g.76716 Transcript_32857/m.76716 type:complete len:239 (+) Transcript_32857:509-1225(+)
MCLCPWSRRVSVSLSPTAAATPHAAAPTHPTAAALHRRVILVVRLLRRRIAHRLINGEDQTSRLGGSGERVPLHHGGLPHERLKRVADTVFDDVDAEPRAPVRVLHTKLVEDIGRVHASIRRDLSRDDLKGLGVRSNEQLRLAKDAPRVLTQMRRELHLDGTASCNDRRVGDQPARVHDGVVQRALRLFYELLGPATQDDSASSRLLTPREEIVALAADLPLLKLRALPKHSLVEVVA